MDQKGFGMIEILIVVVIFGALAGGGWYFSTIKNNSNAINIGTTAEHQAEQVVQQTNHQVGQEQKTLNQITSSQSQGGSSASVQQTYKNDKFGFSIIYPADQEAPEILIDPTSSLSYSMVGETPWWIAFYNDPSLLMGRIYNPAVDGYMNLGFSTATQQWILSGKNADVKSCPLKELNHGIAYYSVSDGFHAGDYFSAYVTPKGIIAIGGGVEFVNGAFLLDQVTINAKNPTILVGCVVK